MLKSPIKNEYFVGRFTDQISRFPKSQWVEAGRVRRFSKSHGSSTEVFNDHGSGRVWSGRVGSGRVGSGRVGSP